MRAQICFFVSIVFSFVAWGLVTSSLILPELRRRGRNEALRPLLMFHSFRFVGLAFLVPRPAGGFRRRRRLWRYRRRGARFVSAGVTARQAWHRRGLGIQSVGHRRYHPRQLRRHSLRRPARSNGRCLLSPNFYRAALSDHARTHILASTAKRKRSRRAGQITLPNRPAITNALPWVAARPDTRHHRDAFPRAPSSGIAEKPKG